MAAKAVVDVNRRFRTASLKQRCMLPREMPYLATVLLVKTKSRMLEVLAFDEYWRFDTSDFFWGIKRASLYSPKESRSIKTAIDLFIEN